MSSAGAVRVVYVCSARRRCSLRSARSINSDRFSPATLASASASASTAASTVTEIFSFAIPLSYQASYLSPQHDTFGLERPSEIVGEHGGLWVASDNSGVKNSR